MSLSNDLYQSFVRYQSLIRKEYEHLSARHNFIEVEGERAIQAVNRDLRTRIAEHLGIRNTKYQPSRALSHLWR
jgi:dTMP kinase